MLVVLREVFRLIVTHPIVKVHDNENQPASLSLRIKAIELFEGLLQSRTQLSQESLSLVKTRADGDDCALSDALTLLSLVLRDVDRFDLAEYLSATSHGTKIWRLPVGAFNEVDCRAIDAP